MDFDGVICDSMDECMFSSYNAYLKLISVNQRINNLEEINSEKRKEFRRLRPFIRGGEDYILFFFIIEDGIKIIDQLHFDKIREEKKHKLVEYKKALYEERDFLLKNNRDLWLNLNPLFEVGNFLKEKSSFDNVFILSTKKKEYVFEILKFHEINFPRENITYTLPQEKINNLLNLLKQKGVDLSKSIFIEDQVEFLLEAKKFNVGVSLVDWSYATDEQKEKAKNNGVEVIDISRFSEIVGDF
jgi:phosphoglycolate phosphatase-like HAD superfamily hydrolase